MNSKAIISFLLFFCATQTFAHHFKKSKWIWSNDIAPNHIAPPGPRAFRREFYPKKEKTLLPCSIDIAAHDGYDLFVNGKHTGSGPRTPSAQSHSAILQPGRNVFAVRATNGVNVPNIAGLLIDIQVRYTDGSTDGVVSDPSWRVSTSIPAGFEGLGFDHSSWPQATVVENYGPTVILSPPSSASIGNIPPAPTTEPIPKEEPKPEQPTAVRSTPHPTPDAIPNPQPLPKQTPKPIKPETQPKPEPGPKQKPEPTQKAEPKQEPPKPKPKPLTAPACPPKSSKALSLTDANWVWTNEIKGGNAPIGARAFRKTIPIPRGLAATSAKILLGVDDHFTLYVQGKPVGTGAVWSAIHNYVVDLRPAATSEVVIAVNAANAEGGPAGLIAAIELELEGCSGSVLSITSDGTWKYSTNIPSGFEKPSFDDSKWDSAKIEGKYGIGPWGRLAIPSAVSRATV